MSHMNGQYPMSHTCAARDDYKSVVLKPKWGIPKQYMTDLPDEIFGKRVTLIGLSKTSFIVTYKGEFYFVAFHFASYLSKEEGE